MISVRVRRTASSTTPTPDEDDEDLDEDESVEADDDGKVYKNPRNSPSTLCPRDEEQATLLVGFTKYIQDHYYARKASNSVKGSKM